MFVVHVEFFKLLRWAFYIVCVLSVMHDKFGWWL
jgi:hypothetical protein